MEMNTKQRVAVDFVTKGHNLVIMGKAGTGKTLTVKNIVSLCNTLGKTCAVTATTGIACSLYPPWMKAMTIHRWSGINDGRYSPPEIKTVVSNNVKQKDALNRILKTEVLIIDEFSMMSRRFMECLSAVCSLKDATQVFGGIQIILVGDILQLPPVPCARYNEEGAFCFESDLFPVAFPHRISLDEVYRQTDIHLLTAIEEISLGCVTDETCELMRVLSRPIDSLSSSIVKLFSTNDLVDDYNRDQILDHPGTLHEFRSVDNGERKHMKDTNASKTLWLKLGIPIILIKNLSDQLVNGLRGTVYDVQEDRKIVVDFPTMKEKIVITPERFEVFDPRRNAVVAVRTQIPLQPAFALTIHKSQGMTLERVQVDCQDIFKPGQLGVAIGRARTLEGLRVINFSKRACFKQPEKIIQFWSECDSLNIEEDKTCCNGYKSHASPSDQDTDIIVVNDDTCQDTEDELEDDFNDVIAAIGTDEQCKDISLPESLVLQNILQSLKSKTVISPQQSENNEIVFNICYSKLEVFAKQQYSKISSLLSTCKTSESGQIVSKDLGEFYTKVHTYSVGLEFKMQCLQLFRNESTYTSMHQRVAYNIFVKIREFIINVRAKEVKATSESLNSRTVTQASRARIRYVGGYCIAKVKHKYVTKKATYRYSNKKMDKHEYEMAKCAIEILNRLKDDEQSVFESTEDPDSLIDTYRRQNLNRSLTNIPDFVFKFFIQLTEKCLVLLTDDNLNRMGPTMFNECQNIIEKSNLYEEFVKICCKSKIIDTECKRDPVESLIDEMTQQVEMFEKIYHHIVKYHLMVMLNQFRKDTLDSLRIEKKMAHRKQIRVSAPGDSKKRTGSIDKSNKPQKKKRNDQSCNENEPQASTSAEHDIQSELDIKCKVCNTIEKENLWIQCQNCNEWLHRNCAGLKHHMKWKKYQKKSSIFKCNECER